jgi:glycerol-3-phosphate acyltransferase PlsY
VAGLAKYAHIRENASTGADLELMHGLLPLVATLLAYLVGSLSFAVIVSRVMGLSDPRTFGSKNPGATNVLRSGSKGAAVLTLLLDAAKGWLPVMLVRWFGKPYGLEDGTVAMVGLAAFLGHLYPVFFRFAGGKGVATALGVLLGLNVWLGVVTLLIWLVDSGVVSAIHRSRPLFQPCWHLRSTLWVAVMAGTSARVLPLAWS